MASRRESDFQRLQDQLRDAQERAEAELRSRQQAELRAGQAEQRAGQAELRAEEERKRNRQTTLEQFVRACHNFLSKPLVIQSDKSLSTKGSVTSPKGKLCPTHLRPWAEFPQLQQRVFDSVYSFFHPPSRRALRLFSPVLYLEELGQRVCRRELASERDLESYERFAVEDPITDIVSRLSTIPEARESFGLSDGMSFENHANSLSDIAEEVQQRLHIGHSHSPIRSPSTPPIMKPSQADQICVYQNTDGTHRLLLVVEYKAPHKLSVENLRGGLRVMNIPAEVINRTTIPTDRDERLNYNADQLVAAVVTQTFSYMIESGLEYSYITTGEAYVFLQVKQDDPTTVYYHLAEPNVEAEAQDEYGFRYPRTAISQVLCFCLMAMRSHRRSQSWRDRAAQRLQRYEIDHEAVLRQIPEDERNQTPPSSIFKTRRHPIDLRSPYFLRRRKGRDSCSSVEAVGEDHGPPSSEESDKDPEGLDTPSKTERRSKGKESADSNRNEAPTDAPSRKYCTQACLLGLTKRTRLDENCPNVSAHRGGGTGNQHLIDLLNFQRMIQQQLESDLDHDCEPLGKQGARGALFKITLAAYGYTVVGKGTVEVFVRDLQHEGRIYQRLKSLQGMVIPVYLGNIDLPKIYYLDVGVRIQHMMLMSWVGEEAKGSTALGHEYLKKQIQTSTEEIRRAGVMHGDVRSPNILWSQERQRVMLIDFERATTVLIGQFDGNEERDRGVLQRISPNRKRKFWHEAGSKEPGQFIQARAPA